MITSWIVTMMPSSPPLDHPLWTLGAIANLGVCDAGRCRRIERRLRSNVPFPPWIAFRIDRASVGCATWFGWPRQIGRGISPFFALLRWGRSGRRADFQSPSENRRETFGRGLRHGQQPGHKRVFWLPGTHVKTKSR